MHADLARLEQRVGGRHRRRVPERRARSELAAAMQLMQAFEAIKARPTRGEPTDDLTTLLLEAEVDGEPLSPPRFKMFLFLLALAGNETTRNGISHAVLDCRCSRRVAAAARRPALIPLAVEEVLRYALPPVLYFRRNAVADMAVGGSRSTAGDIVSLWYVSANRDDAHFADPSASTSAAPPTTTRLRWRRAHFCLAPAWPASSSASCSRPSSSASPHRAGRPAWTGSGSNFLHGIKHLPVRLGR